MTLLIPVNMPWSFDVWNSPFFSQWRIQKCAWITMQQKSIVSLYLIKQLSAKVFGMRFSGTSLATLWQFWFSLFVFIESIIHLLTRYSQPTLDMSIHEADWVLVLHWILYGNYFSLKAFWIHTNYLSPTHKEGGWPLWLLNSVKLPIHAFCPINSLLILQIPKISDIISKEQQENAEGFYLWQSEERGRVRGKLQGAISAEKWEWKGWKPINENQYKKAGRHKNWGGR